MSRARPRIGLAAMTAAVLALAACSSGSSDAARTTTSKAPGTTTSGPAATSTTTVANTAGWSTFYGDAARTGSSATGPASPASARQLWSTPVLDGDLYAQPLVVGDRVVVATENDTVYALRASDGTVAWKTHLGEPVSGSSLPCGNVDPVGITSTPVIDASADRVYAVGMEQPGRHTLWALQLSTGKLVDSTRVDVTGADPSVQNQRSALTLSAGKVFVPFGGRYGDCGDYRGRVASVVVSGAKLGTPSSYTLPTEGQGGFWAPPGASVAADGSLYLASGNSTSRRTYDYGNSVVRLSPDLQLLDSFAPSNWATLDASDTDLGSTGPVLLPGDRVFQVGKGGTGYLLDATTLGGVGGQLHAGRVCDSSAFGAVAHDGSTMFVPCLSGVVQVTANANTFTVGWTTALSSPGPTIVANGAVWTVATDTGDLVALDPASGKVVLQHHIGSVPSRFTSPAAAGGHVLVGADRTLFAYGN